MERESTTLKSIISRVKGKLLIATICIIRFSVSLCLVLFSICHIVGEPMYNH